MKVSVIVLPVVVALLGVGSAVLGFKAESTKLAPNDIKVYSNECVYPANPAPTLGLVAALLLLVAQITGSAVGGCCGCCKPRCAGFSGSKPVSKSKRAIGAALSVLSWIVALIAERYFLVGAMENIPMTRQTSQGWGCQNFAKDGVFTIAAILSIVATVLGIISYIVLYAAAEGAAATTTTTLGVVAGPSSAGETKHDGIAIGQPAAAQQNIQAV